MSSRRFFIIGRPGRDDRPPLPAGHPVSWGAITRDTVLEGTAYPDPPMTRAAPGAQASLCPTIRNIRDEAH